MLKVLHFSAFIESVIAGSGTSGLGMCTSLAILIIIVRTFKATCMCMVATLASSRDADFITGLYYSVTEDTM